MDISGRLIFMSGVLIGSLLDAKTALILTFIGILIQNDPLPITGELPRTLAYRFFSRIIGNNKDRVILKIRKNRNKNKYTSFI
jgi:hypothetical protein